MQQLLENAVCIRQYLTYPATQERNQTLFSRKSKVLLDTSGDDSLCNRLPSPKISKVYFKKRPKYFVYFTAKNYCEIFFYKGTKFKLLKLAVFSPEPLLFGPIQSSIVQCFSACCLKCNVPHLMCQKALANCSHSKDNRTNYDSLKRMVKTKKWR